MAQKTTLTPEMAKEVISKFQGLTSAQKNLTLGFILGIMGTSNLPKKERRRREADGLKKGV